MFNILLIAFCLLFAWFCFKNIRWGIYLVLLLLPTYQIRFQILGIPVTLLEAMIWLLFVVWLLKLRKEKGLTFNPVKIIKNIFDPQYSILKEQNPIPKPFRLPLILLLIAATISVFVSPNLDSALGIWKAYFVEALMFFIIFVYNIAEIKHPQQVIRILGLLTIIVGLFALYQKLTGAFIPNPFWAAVATRRVTTFFGYPNANGLLIAPILMLTLGNFMTDIISMAHKKRFAIRDSRYVIFDLLVLVLGSLTILWTKSAGALIGVLAGLIGLLIGHKKPRLITLAALLVLIFILAPQIQTKIQSYYIAAGEIHLSDRPSDWQLRVQQWRETLAMLKDTPIFGPGLNGYQTLMVPYHINKHIEIFLYPHNFFLNFWSETGLLGLMSFIWIIGVFFWSLILDLRSINNQRPMTEDQSIKTRYILTIATSCAMLVLLVHGLVDVPYFKNDLSILFWVIVGMMIILIKKQETTNPSASLRTGK